MKPFFIFLAMTLSGCISTASRKTEKDVYLLKYRVNKLEKLVNQMEGDISLINGTPPETFCPVEPELPPIVRQKPLPVRKLPTAPAAPLKKQ